MKRMRAICYFADQCGECHGCDCFTPINDEGEDILIASLISKRKNEFRREWQQYISEWNDESFNFEKSC